MTDRFQTLLSNPTCAATPGIMFLDEPTTGLDSTNAAKVVDILSGLGTIGVTVGTAYYDKVREIT